MYIYMYHIVSPGLPLVQKMSGSLGYIYNGYERLSLVPPRPALPCPGHEVIVFLGEDDSQCPIPRKSAICYTVDTCTISTDSGGCDIYKV